MKKIICLILSAIILTCTLGTASFAATSPATQYAGGEGTESSPYQISTVAELLYFADQINSGDETGKYYKLTADIDMTGESWTPVGTKDRPFKGTFDGNGRIIKNVTVTATVPMSLGNNYITSGFFGVIGGAKISKLGLENVTLALDADDLTGADGMYAAGFCGQSLGTGGDSIKESFIKNVRFDIDAGSTRFDIFLSAFVSRTMGDSSVVEACYANGVTFNDTAAGTTYVGFASHNGVYKDCYTNGVEVWNTSTSVKANSFGNSTQSGNQNLYTTWGVSGFANREVSIGGTAAITGKLVTQDNLYNLTGGVAFTAGKYQENNSTGAPLLYWEYNPVGYAMTVAASQGGAVTLSSNVVIEGSKVTVTATPNEGYAVKAVTAKIGDGDPTQIWNGYSKTAVAPEYEPTADTVFSAVFEKLPVNVSPSLGNYTTKYESKANLFVANNNPNAYISDGIEVTAGDANEWTNISAAGSGANITIWLPQRQKSAALKHTFSYDILFEEESWDVGDVLIDFAEQLKKHEKTSRTAGIEQSLSIKVIVAENNKLKIELDENPVKAVNGDDLLLDGNTYYKFKLDIDAMIGHMRFSVYDTQTGNLLGSYKDNKYKFKDVNFLARINDSVYTEDSKTFRVINMVLNVTKGTKIKMKEMSNTQEEVHIEAPINVRVEDNKLKVTHEQYLFGKDKATIKLNPIYISVYTSGGMMVADAEIKKEDVMNDQDDEGVDFKKAVVDETVDLSKYDLKDGAYKLNGYVWSTEDVPCRNFVTKTLTVSTVDGEKQYSLDD